MNISVSKEVESIILEQILEWCRHLHQPPQVAFGTWDLIERIIKNPIFEKEEVSI